MKVAQSPQVPQPVLQPQRGIVGAIREYVHHVRQFSAGAKLFLIGSFLMGMTFELFQLLMPLYLREQGMGEGEIGQILSGRATGMALLAIPASIALSRFPIRPMLICSALLFALFSGLSIWQDESYLIYSCTFGMGVAFTFFRVSGAPFFMRNSSAVERTYLFSASFGLLVLAGLVGSATAGRMVVLIGDAAGSRTDGFHLVMLLGAAIALSAIVPFAAIRESQTESAPRSSSIRFDLIHKQWPFLAKICWTHALVGLGAGLIIPFLPLYFRDQFAQPPDMIGLFQGLVAGSMFLGALAGPFLSRHLGLVRSVVVSQLASLPFMIALAFIQWLPLAVVAFVCRGALMNMAVPLGTNFAMEACEQEAHGLVNAVIMIAWTGSWMISTQIGGQLIESHGYEPTLLISAGLYLCASLSYFLFFRKAEQRNANGAGWSLAEGDAA